MRRGLILSAPASGSGKTVLALGILRALRDLGVAVAAAKCGPDFIDPRFHDRACGGLSLNLDPWAMRAADLRALAGQSEGDLLLVEGAMGMFDGAPPDGRGSTAALALALGLPVVLVIDAAKQGHSVAAVAEGFARHRKGVFVSGVILNRTGSPRHEAMLRAALADFPVLGCIPRDPALVLASRHLGLVQASEIDRIERFITHAGAVVQRHLDLNRLQDLATSLPGGGPLPPLLPPPGQRIAIASDAGFSFAYPHVLDGWQSAGATLHPFSPLADEAPDPHADAIFLPGGYPELHAGRLAATAKFRAAMHAAAKRGTVIYGECGGFMALGDGLVDGLDQRHAMLGLLRLETSFAKPRLHLGYRHLQALGGPWDGAFNGHEFHYSTQLRAEGAPLFAARNAEGDDLGPVGLRDGTVCGSYAHLIAKAAPA